MNIYQRINAVMKEEIYVKKGKAGQGTGVNYDDLIPELAPMMRKHGIVQVVTQKSMVTISEIGKQKIYQGEYQLDLVNIDEPKDIATYTAFAQGMDGGDKGPGKAHTYAVKIMLSKAFMLETGDNEESRGDQRDINLITAEQVDQLFPLLCDSNGVYTEKGSKICRAFKFSNLSDIKSKKFDNPK